MSHALVVVHLSSLDSFHWHEAQATGDDIETWKLASEIAYAIGKHPGPTYIVDQDWPTKSTESAPRRDVMRSIEGVPEVRWIHFDEDKHSWKRFLPALAKTLKEDGVREVTLGGVWFDPDLKSGCVSKVYTYLRTRMPTKVDPKIVGCATW